MSGMKRNSLFLLVAALAIAGCCCDGYRYDDGIEYVSDDGNVTEQYVEVETVGEPGYLVSRGASDYDPYSGQQVIKYSTPNGNDLKVETSHHILKVEGVPNKSYDYYIWAGDKTYADEPDVVIQDAGPSLTVKD